jgi:tetraacyldisaccharide 4'-kinase
MNSGPQRWEQKIWTPKDRFSLLGGALRSPLLVMSGAYGLFMRARRTAYQNGILASAGVESRVIVVGNLSVGGSGKTPIAAWIANELASSGKKTSVVLRGYKSRYPGEIKIVSRGDGPLTGHEEAGDEAWLLAKKLPGVPVVAGKDRVRACETAMENFGATHLVLDDGFQHLRLKRDLDILVMPAGSDPANEHLLPRGPLREPIGAAKAADAIVISGVREQGAEPWPWLEKVCPGTPVFNMRYRPGKIEPLGETREVSKDAPALAFCGIGSPESFFDSLEEAGIDVKDRVALGDHHSYDPGRIESLAKRADAVGALRLITTEKDAVKIEFGWSRGFPIDVFCVEPDFMGREKEILDLAVQG